MGESPDLSLNLYLRFSVMGGLRLAPYAVPYSTLKLRYEVSHSHRQSGPISPLGPVTLLKGASCQ